MNFSSDEIATYELRRGDVLVVEASGSASEVGKPAIWDGSIPICCFQNTLLRLRSRILDPEYLYFVLLAHARIGTLAHASKGVGIHHLSKSGLAKLMIETPTIEKQRERVAAISDQQQKCATIENAISTELKRAGSLRSSILATAFSGKLVPRDISGASASALLQRIAAKQMLPSSERTDQTLMPRTQREQVMT